MAGLTGKTIASTYTSVLRTLADGGLTSSLQVIEDGAGNDSVLYLATDSALIYGSGVPLYFGDADGGEYIWGDTTDLRIYSGADILLSPGGNVGIGTFTPGARLHVYKAASTETSPVELLRLEIKEESSGVELGAGGGPAINFYVAEGTTTSELNGQIAVVREASGDDDSAAAMTFWTGANDSTSGTGVTEQMRIASTGYVGIGTSGPAYVLDIKGKVPDTTGENILAVQETGGDHVFIVGKDVDEHGYVNILAASEALTIHLDSDDVSYFNGGNVGIGIAAPTSTLHVKTSDDSIAHFKSTDDIAQILISDDADTAYFGMSDDNNTCWMGFASGNSTSNINILGDGKVGIGTTTPQMSLNVSGVSNGAILISRSDADVIADNTDYAGLYFGAIGDDTNPRVGCKILATTAEEWSDGGTDAGTDMEFYTCDNGDGTLDLKAYLAAGGDWYTNDGSVSSIASDERLKKDIRDFEHGLSVVNQLNPVYYKFNGKGGRDEDIEDRIGMLANKVKDVAPDLVQSQMGDLDGVETELYTMSYSKIIFYAVKAIQELSAKVTALENA